MPTHETDAGAFYMDGVPFGQVKSISFTTSAEEEHDPKFYFDLSGKYEFAIDHLRGRKISRKKFKKYLMSHRYISRNMAEAVCKVLQLKHIPYGDAKVQFVLGGWNWVVNWVLCYA